MLLFPRKIHKSVGAMLVDGPRMEKVLAAQLTPGGADPADVRLLIAEGALGTAMFADSASATSLSNFGTKVEALLTDWDTKANVTDADVDQFVNAASLLEEEYTESCGEKMIRTARNITLKYGERDVAVKVVFKTSPSFVPFFKIF